jgi:hypothetical protein
MGTVAKLSGTGQSKPAPAGNHVAVCVGVIDLGTQFVKGYQGQPDDWVYQVMLQWELSDALMDDGRPFMVSRRLRLSMHEMSGLRKILQSWRGGSFSEAEAREFDVKNVLGKPCMLNLVHKTSEKSGTVYANVDSISPLHKQIARPEPVNPLVYYAIEEGDPEKAGLPEWVCKLIRQSKEFTGQSPASMPTTNGSPPADNKDDPIPF